MFRIGGKDTQGEMLGDDIIAKVRPVNLIELYNDNFDRYLKAFKWFCLLKRRKSTSTLKWTFLKYVCG